MIFVLAALVGIVILQIHLSKKENKWMGLALPIVIFAISLLAVAGMAAYVEHSATTQLEYIDGDWVTTTIPGGGNREAIPGAIAGVIYTFLLMNIPTVILLVIYKAARNKKSQQREIEKMSMQDLE